MTDLLSKVKLKAKHPVEIMSESSLLNKLRANANKLLSIEDLIQRNLSLNLQVAALQGDTLHLIAPSSSAATNMRYRQQTIISLIRNQYPIEKLKLSVRPNEPPPPPYRKPPIKPSAENARQITIAAQYIENEGLRKALIKLSRRAHKSKAAQ